MPKSVRKSNMQHKIFTIRNITFLTVLIICLSNCGFAQNVNTLHFMRLNPYSNYTNPASFIPFNAYIGFPAAGNINFSLTNTSLHYNNIFKTEAGKPVVINADKLVKHLSNSGNWMNTNINIDILDFGFRVKRSFFSFSCRTRIDESLRFSKDVLAFPIKGNMNYLGENNTADLDIRLNLNAYTEIGIGVQTEINEHLYIGARPKLLFGLFNLRTQNMNAKIYTHESDCSIKMNYGIDANMMSIVPIIFNDSSLVPTIGIEDFMHNWQSVFKNVGAAVDLGMVYRFNDRFGIAASVLDLGFIRWKSNGTRFTGAIDSAGTYYDAGNFVFNGLSVDDLTAIRDNTSEYIDRLMNYFPIDKDCIEKYTTVLSTHFLVEGYYNFGKCHRLTALLQGKVINKKFIPSFTIAYDGNFFRILDVCVHYTMAKKSFLNLGVGLGVNLGIFQIYAATENILAVFGSPVLKTLMNSSFVNAQLGIVFNWGKIQEQKMAKDVNL